MTVEGQVKEILLTILDVKEEEIVPTAIFTDDLRATSIDIVEILTALQNAFNVEIDDDQASKLRTVQDAVDFLKETLERKQTAR